MQLSCSRHAIVIYYIVIHCTVKFLFPLKVINEQNCPQYYFNDFPCKGEAYGNRANIEYM